MKKSILFLCTGNACRSQMAEGFAKKYLAQDFEIYSAGIIATGIFPEVFEVMNEVGVDITSQKSKTIGMLPDVKIDYVITLCDNARNTCPVFPAKTKTIHRGFDDPPMMSFSSYEKKMEAYRRVRDEIEEFIKSFWKNIKGGEMKNPFTTHGAISWNELCTTDTKGAKDFYGELFGWKYEETEMPSGETYNTITAGDIMFGGIMKLPKGAEKMPPAWGCYITCDDVDATAKQVEKLGGKILMPPTDIPETGRFICFSDPQGAVIMAITYIPMEKAKE